jgi:hypothetical protein
VTEIERQGSTLSDLRAGIKSSLLQSRNCRMELARCDTALGTRDNRNACRHLIGNAALRQVFEWRA